MRPRTPIIAYIATCMACAAPVLLVTYPPMTDLPQHVAQVAQAMRGQLGASQFVAWWAPNNLVYLPMMLLWRLVASHQVGPLAVALLSCLWVSANFALATYLRRPLVGAILASLLFYNGILYWGMLNFILGWPAFVLWWILFDRVLAPSGQVCWKTYAALIVSSFVLMWTHVLALGFAGVVAVTLTSYRWHRLPSKAHVIRLASFVPVTAIAIPWALQLRTDRLAFGFPVDAIWSMSPLERGHYMVFRTASNGDGFETVILFTALATWILGGLLPKRGSPRERQDSWHGALAVTGCIAVAFSLLLPDKYLNTISFGVRWIPWAFLLFLMATPGPPLRRSLLNGYGGLLAAYFLLTTSLNWIRFERTNLTGLRAAILAVPSGARVMGLDYLKVPMTFDADRPFIQLMAYANVERGASLNFDFSQHQTGLVRGTVPLGAWTQGLEWFAEWARPSDLRYFDYALVGVPDLEGISFPLAPWLEPVTSSGTWRLYKSALARPFTGPPQRSAVTQ